MTSELNSDPRYIGVFLFDDVEELDAVGPWEVLGAWTAEWPQDGWRLVAFSDDGCDVRGSNGLRIGADYSFSTVPRLDALVYPGGAGTRPLANDDEHLTWVRQQAASGTLMTSVSTGALVFAAAGLLENKRATTYWGALDHLTTLDPTVTVCPDDRFVDEGSVITAAGVSAGIDMALHLVARLAGVARAREVRRAIQYDPQPPV